MKPKHTKDQRKRLFLLARLLDKVPHSRFNMSTYFGHEEFSGRAEHAKPLKEHACGTTGCALGWALTIPSIAKITQNAGTVASAAFGMPWNAETEIFYRSRNSRPRTVAADIRRYLKDGTLPKS